MFFLHEVFPNRSVGTLSTKGRPTAGLGWAGLGWGRPGCVTPDRPRKFHSCTLNFYNFSNNNMVLILFSNMSPI